MTIQNLPAALQSIIQQGYLEREFHDALKARLGFRAIADKEPFSAGIGETLTKTRRGLLAPMLTPMSVASNTDLTSGLTPKNYGVEQFILGIDQYADQMMLNVVTSRVAIVDQFLQQTAALAEQAARSIDMLAQRALFAVYLGGNTRVITTLGSPAATIRVDDIRGFQTTLSSTGAPIVISASNPVNVVVNLNTYILNTATPDGSNISTAPSGISGTLTFTTNVTTADGTAGNSVTSAVAPPIIRPTVTSTGVQFGNTGAIAAASVTDGSAAKLTTAMILAAKAQLALNNVPPLRDGRYPLFADPAHLVGVYADPAFQRFFTGSNDSSEYRNGVIGELLGVLVVETNLNPTQVVGSGIVRRALLCGQGALIEGEFTSNGYKTALQHEDAALITMVDGVAHVVRPPLDALAQVITQSWSYIGGFVAPTDTTANPTVLPSATNAAYKRAVMLESL